MRIADARRYMGIAYKIDHANVTLGTYGEWDSHIEGGARIRGLRVDVPAGLMVRKEQGLIGEKSRANGLPTTDPDSFDTQELKRCYWYGPRGPNAEWQAIAMQTDGHIIMKGCM